MVTAVRMWRWEIFISLQQVVRTIIRVIHLGIRTLGLGFSGQIIVWGYDLNPRPMVTGRTGMMAIPAVKYLCYHDGWLALCDLHSMIHCGRLLKRVGQCLVEMLTLMRVDRQRWRAYNQVWSPLFKGAIQTTQNGMSSSPSIPNGVMDTIWHALDGTLPMRLYTRSPVNL